MIDCGVPAGAKSVQAGHDEARNGLRDRGHIDTLRDAFGVRQAKQPHASACDNSPMSGIQAGQSRPGMDVFRRDVARQSPALDWCSPASEPRLMRFKSVSGRQILVGEDRIESDRFLQMPGLQ